MFSHLFDIHRGETCIVMGNGPSLNSVPNSFLQAYPTFGSNRIYLAFTPTYYVCINPLVLRQNINEIGEVDSVAKFTREGIPVRSTYYLHSSNAPMFSYNPCQWVYEGYTVTFVALQLAFFMGFSKVILVGVDHRYTYDGMPNEELVLTGDDPNHFDPDYFKGMKWNAPDLERSEIAYLMAKEAYDKNGRHIVNMTEGSALDVFDTEGVVWAK